MAMVEISNGGRITVKVGQAVWFKSDTEQHGIITAINGNQLTLKAPSDRGFCGDYISGRMSTIQMARDCWIEWEMPDNLKVVEKPKKVEKPVASAEKTGSKIVQAKYAVADLTEKGNSRAEIIAHLMLLLNVTKSNAGVYYSKCI